MRSNAQMLEAKPGDPASGRTWAHPPAIFVHMARDANTARAVAADMAALKKQARILSYPRSSPLRNLGHADVCGASIRGVMNESVTTQF